VTDSSKTSTYSRRSALGIIAVTAAGGAFLSARARAQSPSPALASPLLLEDAGVCTITPEMTEGPFYFDPKLDRADITEAREGVPLEVRLQVVDQACAPLAGARVDVWHCDARGHYSGYPGQGDGRDVDTSGETFLRGWQTTDETGIVRFNTIYPGWYRGRTTHIHFKVVLPNNGVMTGQMFFPDGLSEAIFTTADPYTDRTERRDTMNTDDGILRRAGAGVQSAVRETGAAYVAMMIIGVAV